MNLWRNPIGGALSVPEIDGQSGAVLKTLDRAALLALFLVLSVPALAFTAPTTGDLAFEIYDIIVNDGIEGPIPAVITVDHDPFAAYCERPDEETASSLGAVVTYGDSHLIGHLEELARLGDHRATALVSQLEMKGDEQ